MTRDPGKPVPEHDAELASFMSADVQEGRRVRIIPWHRVVLTAGVLFALGWLGSDGLDELRYHFSGQELHKLGDAPQVDPVELEPGRYVELTGVLGNKAATVSGLRPGSFRRGPIQVRQLLGSQVFVEFDQDSLYGRYQPFRQVTVKGRLVDFGPGGDLGAVREYFWQRFRMDIPPGARLLVVDEAPGELWRYPLLLGAMALVALLSLVFLVRASGTRIIED